MKQIRTYLIVGIIVLLVSSNVFSLPLQSNSNRNQNPELITLSYRFSSPLIQTISIDNNTYTRITLDSLPTMGNPGTPQLPVKGAYILLPPNKTVKNIDVERSKTTTYQINDSIIPSTAPIPRSKIVVSNTLFPKENSQIYNGKNPYPLKSYSIVGTYSQRGYSVLIVQLYPIQYYPTQNKIVHSQEFTLSVMVETEEQNHVIRPLSQDRDLIRNRVDNPELVDRYLKNTKSLYSETYDFLIITHESLKQSFNQLKEYHDNRGIATKIYTIDEIRPILSSNDTAENMRAFIRDQYENFGIQYVLLGGDTDFVPCKMLYVHGMDEDKWPMETTLPADFYFGCLDSVFNYDNDDRWGEPTDGKNGGDVDLLSEVFVGRAACDTPKDVNAFVNKTILYDSLRSSNPDLKNILMAGEYLGDYGVASWGGNYLDLLLNDSQADNYTTKGIPVSMFNIIKLYDRDHPKNEWMPEDLMSFISNNIHIINHDGHSNYAYNMKLVNYQVRDMNNSIPFFDYSVGCMSGGFDNPNEYDCFAEYITVKAEHGAFSAIMNARYGFFWAYSTDGDGTRYMREFWDAIFGENTPGISKAHQDSCEDNIYLIDRSCMRWTFYGLNYFGDPSICLNIGEEPSVPHVDGPSNIKPNEKATFSAYATDADSDELFYLFDWGDGSNSEWIGPYIPGEIVEISHEWIDKGDYEVRVKAKDTQGFESGWSRMNMKVPHQFQSNSFKIIFINFLMQFLEI